MNRPPKLPAVPWLRRLGWPGFAALATVLVMAWINFGSLEWSPVRYKGVLINEYWHVAAALVEGRGFADPFGMESGPTAWVPPLLAWIYSLLLLSLPGQSSAYLAAGCIKAAGYALSAWIWTDLLGRRVGRGAAVLFVLVWLALLAPTQRLHLSLELHDPWLVGLVLAFTLWSFDRLGRRRDGRWWAAGAFALGPLAGPVVTFAQIGAAGLRFAACVARDRRLWWRAGLRPLVPSILAASITGGAWCFRCRAAMDAWVPIKSNGAYEAWQAQCATKDGVPSFATFFDHPFLSDVEAAKFVREGEVAYVRRHGEMFSRALREAPGDFLNRVGARAFNAFVWLRSPIDNLPVKERSEIIALLPDLRGTDLVREAGAGEWHWLEVSRQPEACWSLLQGAPALDERARLLVFGAWSRAHAALMAHRATFPERARGFAMAGAPFLAALGLLLLDRWRRRATTASFWALAYFVYLAPYVVISHYERYQIPLFGLQAVLASVFVWRFAAWIRRRGSDAPVARAESV